MKIYDVSLNITPAMPVWPGDPGVKLQRVAKIEEGSHANVSHIEMGVHTGTHVDAPYHFIGNDSRTVEYLPLEKLTGEAVVLQLPDQVDSITAARLEAAQMPDSTRRLLLKTSNSQYWANNGNQFQEDFVAVSPDGAEWLVERGIEVIGVDYLSVAPFHDGVPTHKILLNAGVIIVEGLDLSNVPAGEYLLYCLPLKLVGADGAPARVILIGD